MCRSLAHEYWRTARFSRRLLLFIYSELIQNARFGSEKHGSLVFSRVKSGMLLRHIAPCVEISRSSVFPSICVFVRFLKNIFSPRVVIYLFSIVINFVFSKCLHTHTCIFNINITSVSYKTRGFTTFKNPIRVADVVTRSSFHPRALMSRHVRGAHRPFFSHDGRRRDLTGRIFTFIIHHFFSKNTNKSRV